MPAGPGRRSAGSARTGHGGREDAERCPCWPPPGWRRGGLGACVVSASAGLNEPTVVTAVSSRNLGAQAGGVERNTDLDPHRFSRAWQCARQATSGRIVALANSTVDGDPARLVYTRAGATTQVTVVTGCDSGRPSAGPSALVPPR